VSGETLDALSGRCTGLGAGVDEVVGTVGGRVGAGGTGCTVYERAFSVSGQSNGFRCLTKIVDL
jgi:hypothetical protein